MKLTKKHTKNIAMTFYTLFITMCFVIGITFIIGAWKVTLSLVALIGEASNVLLLLNEMPREHKLWFWLVLLWVFGQFIYILLNGGFKICKFGYKQLRKYDQLKKI